MPENNELLAEKVAPAQEPLAVIPTQEPSAAQDLPGAGAVDGVNLTSPGAQRTLEVNEAREKGGAPQSREIESEDDDITSSFHAREKESEAREAYEFLSQKYGLDRGTAETEAPPAAAAAAVDGPVPQPTPTPADAAKGIIPFADVGRDVFRGGIETPWQMVGGARDAIQNTANIADDLGAWMKKKGILGGGITYDNKNGLQFLNQKNYGEWLEKYGKESNTLPEVAKGKTVTGGIVRGVSQFMTGFLGASKVTGAVKTTSVVGQFLKSTAQGAIADFTVFDPHEKRLSNLIQENPRLANPVNEFLQANPNDSGLEARTKQTLEGMGLGAMSEGFIQSLKLLRQARMAKAVEAAEKGIKQEVDAFAEYGAFDPKSKLLSEKLQEGLDATEDVTVEGVTQKGLRGEPKIEINFDRINEPQDIEDLIQNQVNAYAKDIDEARRGVRPWSATKLSAEQVDVWKTLTKDGLLNAEESLALRDLWATSANKLKEVATIAAANPTEVNLFRFRKMMATHYAVQKRALSVRTETARALNSWKIVSGSREDFALQIGEMINANGGSGVALDMAKRLAKLDAKGLTKGVETFVEGAAFAKTRAVLGQVWINSLLSNPSTFVANGISNFATAFQQVYERKAAEIIHQAVGLDQGVVVGEAMALLSGALAGVKDAFVASWHTLRTGESSIGGAIRKLEAKPGALSAKTLGIKNEPLGKVMNLIDLGTSVPGRFMLSGDEFFKTTGYRMQLHAEALRMATEEVSSGKIAPNMLKKRIAEIIEHPPQQVKDDAVGQALYATFSNKPSEMLEGIASKIQKVPILGRYVLPFKNTPINILTYTGERTPLAFLVKQWRADFAAGGARQEIALSRMATGSMILAAGLDMALSGQLTGKGPGEKNQRANWLAQGNKPYSIKIGDKTYGINRLDPLGMQLGIAADMAEAFNNGQDDIDEDEYQKAVIQTTFAFANNVTSKTYMRGVSEFFAAMANPNMYGETYVKKGVGALLPAGSLLAQVTKFGVPGVIEGDPYLRHAESVLDALRRRIPGLSEDLPLYRDLWGRTIDYRSSEGYAADMLSPVYINKMNPEPVDTELQKIEYYPSMPSRKQTFAHPDSPNISAKIKLDGRQYSNYMRLFGNEAKHPDYGDMGMRDYLNAVFSGQHEDSEMYARKTNGPEGTKADFIRKVMDDYRDLAKEQLWEQDRTIRVDFENAKNKKDSDEEED